MELKDYLKGQEFEAKQFEFKEMVSHKNYERWAKTFSTFANSDGGKILFGVDDDGRAVGIEKETLKQDILYINDICDKMIFPRISYEVEKIKLEDGSFVLVVDVAKSQKRHVWLRRTDGEEVIYVRRDGESVIAHGDQIEDLVLANKREPFDGVVTEKRFSDVTFSKLEEHFKENAKENGKITENLLVSKEAMSPNGYLTNAGLIFADGGYIANCNVACRIWPGASKGSSVMLDRKTYQGDLLSTYEFAKNYISLYAKTGVIKRNDGLREEVPSYPERASAIFRPSPL